MRVPTPNTTWPASWKEAYAYDIEEAAVSDPTPYSFLYNLRQKEVLSNITDILPPSSTILDVAAAQGNFTIALAELGYNTTWNDIRSELAEYVQLKAEGKKIDFLPGNIMDHKGSAQFDAALALEVIEHTAHPDKFLEHLASFVKPNGLIFLSTPNGAYCRNKLPRFSDTSDRSAFESRQFQPNADGHIFLLWPSELKNIADSANLKLEKLSTFGTPLSCGHCGIHHFHRYIPKKLLSSTERLLQHLPRSLRHFLSFGLCAVLRKV